MQNLLTPGTAGNIAYTSLPEEVDAYAVQGDVEAAVDKELQSQVQKAVPQRQDFSATKGAIATTLVLAPPGTRPPTRKTATPVVPPQPIVVPQPVAQVQPAVQAQPQQPAQQSKGLIKSLQGLLIMKH